MRQTPIEYIRAKGLEHKLQSGQIVLKECPFCHDEKWHFYMDLNDKGPWFCHKCQEKGSLWTLIKAKVLRKKRTAHAFPAKEGCGQP
jgi:hypothetical protein